MLDNKDVEKLVDAMKEVFPTAKMMNDSFDSIEKRMATKDQLQNLEKKVDVIDERFKNVEEKIDKLDGIPARVKTLEEALDI